jgi:hypothetical protein
MDLVAEVAAGFHINYVPHFYITTFILMEE